MYTKDFIKEIENLGYTVREYEVHRSIYVFLYPQAQSNIGYVSMDVGSRFYVDGHDPKVDELIVEFGMTPLPKREPQKRYTYKLPEEFDPVQSTITYDKVEEKWFFSPKPHSEEGGLVYQRAFTDADVESLPSIVRRVFMSCDKLEVTE